MTMECFVCEAREQIEREPKSTERAIVFAAVLGNVLENELSLYVCDAHEPLLLSAVDAIEEKLPI